MKDFAIGLVIGVVILAVLEVAMWRPTPAPVAVPEPVAVQVVEPEQPREHPHIYTDSRRVD